MKGRTDRLVLDCLRWLSEGYSVVVVAHPAGEAVRIRRRIIGIARAMGIPCRNVKGAHVDWPVVTCRPFGYPPDTRQLDARVKIVTDHSAVFEKDRQVAPPVRTVIN